MVMFKQMGIENSFTLEATFSGTPYVHTCLIQLFSQKTFIVLKLKLPRLIVYSFILLICYACILNLYVCYKYFHKQMKVLYINFCIVFTCFVNCSNLVSKNLKQKLNIKITINSIVFFYKQEGTTLQHQRLSDGGQEVVREHSRVRTVGRGSGR